MFRQAQHDLAQVTLSLSKGGADIKEFLDDFKLFVKKPVDLEFTLLVKVCPNKINSYEHSLNLKHKDESENSPYYY